MKTFRGFAQERDRLTLQLDKELSKRVLRSQERLRRDLIAELYSILSLDGSAITTSGINLQNASRIIDQIFRQWQRSEGLDIIEFVGRNIFGIHNLNTRYYTSFLNASAVSAAGEKALSLTLARYGVNRDGTIDPDGYLFDIISDNSVSRQLKSVVNRLISSGDPISEMRKNINQTLGTRGVGAIERTVSEGLPSGMLQIDRETNNHMSTDLGLDYAIYQGGEIQTTRPFCEERNNKVFTREEISRFGTSADQFGGYTNKSQGHFQGKTKIYVPFADLGVYNFLHFYSCISNDLDVRMRPDLK